MAKAGRALALARARKATAKASQAATMRSPGLVTKGLVTQDSQGLVTQGGQGLVTQGGQGLVTRGGRRLVDRGMDI